MAAINDITYYFHKENVPSTEKRMRRLIKLGFLTARDKELYPLAVFIRSDVHLQTTIKGKRQKNPKGPHVTFSYKTKDHMGRETHVACHGYVDDILTLEFREATHTKERPDSTIKQSGGFVWPDASEL